MVGVLIALALVPAQAGSGKAPVERTHAAPPGPVFESYRAALDRLGATFDPDLLPVGAIHPYWKGTFTVPFSGRLEAGGKRGELWGTLTVRHEVFGTTEAVVARTRGSGGLWKRVAASLARASIRGTAADARHTVISSLGKERTCGFQLKTLTSSPFPEAEALLDEAVNDVHESCAPRTWAELINRGYRTEELSARLVQAFRDQEEDPGSQAAYWILQVSQRTPEVAALAFAIGQVNAGRSEGRGKAPLICADGTVSPDCVCGQASWVGCCAANRGVKSCADAE